MSELSPLGRQLQNLIDSGAVVPSPVPCDNQFPTARIVVPVYNSSGTSTVKAESLTGGSNAKLEPRS